VADRVGEQCTPCRPTPSGVVLGEDDAESLASIFSALGDPIRLRVLSIIASEGEVCSCNLEGPLERSQPTISHHTNKLAAAGLIVGERRGRWMWWRVVPEQVASVASLIRTFGGSDS